MVWARVEIYVNAKSPGVPCAAHTYDLANRQRYERQVGNAASESDGQSNAVDRESSSIEMFQEPDDELLSWTVAKHVSDCYKSTGTLPTWNNINTTTIGQLVVLERASDEYRVDRPMGPRSLSSRIRVIGPITNDSISKPE